MHCGQALRCAWAWLRASWLSAISGVSRPSASLGRGLRSAGRTVGRPKSRNSLTTFRGQTALRGCPRARGVRCRIAPCRSLCSPPTLPAGRFGLRPRPHWGHASLRDSSLRSPAGKKASIAHFAGGARNGVCELPLTFVRAPGLAFFRRQNGRAFFPPLPIAALPRRSWRETGSTNASWDVTLQLG